MRFVALLLLSLVVMGCVASTDRDRSDDYDRRVMERIEGRYDLEAVKRHLVAWIAEHPDFQGVRAAESRLDQNWKVERVDPPSRVRCGDWILWDTAQGNEEFDLYYEYDQRNARILNLRCRRLTPDRFEVIDVTLDEMVELVE